MKLTVFLGKKWGFLRIGSKKVRKLAILLDNLSEAE